MPRDKFAAMASRKRGDSGDGDQKPAAAADSSTGATGASGATAPPAASANRRDKLAALAAARNSNSPVPPSASAAATATTAKSGGEDNATTTTAPQKQQETPEEIARKKQEYLKKLQVRLSRRNEILDRLDRAEELTCNLLGIAAQTLESLQDFSGEGSSEEALTKLSTAYQQTIQESHPLITQTGSDGDEKGGDNSDSNLQKQAASSSSSTQTLVKAYQNHSNEMKQSFYGARVEMRLAQERQSLLKTFVDLEKVEQQNDAGQDGDGNGGDNPTEQPPPAKRTSRKRSRRK